MTADPFAPLAPETLRAIAASGVVRRFPKHAVLINEGDQGESLFIVLSGRVKVYASNEAGREIVLDFHGPGDYVGASRDMISRLLKDLVAGGYLAIEDRRIVVLRKLPPAW